MSTLPTDPAALLKLINLRNEDITYLVTPTVVISTSRGRLVLHEQEETWSYTLYRGPQTNTGALKSVEHLNNLMDIIRE